VELIENSPDDHADLEKAVALLLSPTITARLTGFVGKPVEKILAYLPDGIEGKLNDLVKVALSKAADAALWSLDNAPSKHASPIWNKTLAGISGGAGGFFGITGLAFELPVSTSVMMRAVADIARSEGFDLDDPETKKSCIEVFALGGESEDDDEVETAYYAMRIFTMEVAGSISIKGASTASRVGLAPAQLGKWLSELIEKVAARFGVVISEKVAAQAIPVIGAVGGAAINMMFTDFYQDMARGHFIVKRLENKYGFDEIKKEFENIKRAKNL